MKHPESLWAVLRIRLRALLLRRRTLRSIDDEIEAHLESLTADRMADGLPRREAHRLALQAFGDRGAIEAELRALYAVSDRPERRPWAWDSPWQDVRYGLRSLWHAPGFTLTALFTLAVGIGAISVTFSVFHSVLLRPLPYDDPSGLVLLYETDRARGTRSEGASAPDYLDWLERTRSFEQLAAMRFENKVLGDGDRPERLATMRVSSSWFPMIGVAPEVGRGFTPDDDPEGAARVALISRSLFESRFGSDPAIVGRTIRLDDLPTTVVGVMPSAAQLTGSPVDLWEPLRLSPSERANRGQHSLIAFGRLAAGVDVERAQAEMADVMAQLEAEYPEDNVNRSVRVAPIQEELVAGIEGALFVLMAAVGLVQLIVCANVANLALARARRRRREMSVRTALGASNGRLVRQLLTESLVLAMLGGALGLALASWGLRVVVAMGPSEIPRLADAAIDPVVLAVICAITLATGILFGIGPALRLARSSGESSLVGRMQRFSASSGRLRHALASAEMALAVVLVIGAGLLLRSLGELRSVDPGFEPEGVLTAKFDLPDARYEFPDGWPWLDWPRATTFFDDLLREVRSVPGVEEAALALNGPMSAGWTTTVTVVGAEPVADEDRDEAGFRPVSAGYFEMLGIPVLKGRSFQDTDRSGMPLVAAVNASFARQYFGDADPIGERLKIFGVERQVVGVVRDVAYRGLARGMQSAVYLPLEQNPLSGLTLLTRSSVDPRTLSRSLRDAVARVDGDLALYSETTLSAALSESASIERFSTLLLSFFASIAMLLAAVGLFGVLSYSVAQRRREIGVRMALGADAYRLVAGVLRDGLVAVGIGLVAGLAGAAALTRLMRSMLFQVDALDPVTFAVVPAVLLGVAALACWLPARRAMSIDPIEILRQE